MTNTLYDHDYLNQIATIQSVVDQYVQIVNNLNDHFVFTKKHGTNRYPHECNDQYPRLQLPYPTNLANVKNLLIKLPQYQASDIDAVVITLQRHLMAIANTLNNISDNYHTWWQIKRQVTSDNKQAQQLQTDLQQLIKQFQHLDQLLATDIKTIHQQRPADVIFAYATTDLDRDNSLNNNQLQQLRNIINNNHRKITQTDQLIAKTKHVNQLLKEESNHGHNHNN